MFQSNQKPDIQTLSMQELRRLAKREGVAGWMTLNRPSLILLLTRFGY